jgi:hypothetical protein
MTHGELNPKSVTTQQAKPAHTYRNIKLKLLKCNASIWCNRHCKANHLTPKYAQFNISEIESVISDKPAMKKTKDHRSEQELLMMVV